MSETTTRRRFEDPSYTEKQFLADIVAMCNGEELTPERIDLIRRKAEYNAEGLALRAERAAARRGTQGSGTAKNPAESEFGVAVENYARQIIESNGNKPMSCRELADAMSAAGFVNENTGKPIQPMWIARVLNNHSDWTVGEDIRTTTGKDNLSKETKCKVYSLR